MQIWLTILASWPEPGAAHHRQRAVLGAGLAAGHRRVDAFEAAFFRRGVQLARDFGRRRGVIDEHFALGHAGEGAVRPKRHLAQVVVIADAAHDEILAFGCGLGRAGGLATVLRHPFFGLGGGAVIDRHIVPAFALEMPGHGIAHDAQAQKRHFRHYILPDKRAERLGWPRPVPISQVSLQGRARQLSRCDPAGLTALRRCLWYRRERRIGGRE
jgi:hypothetical protein